MASAGTQLLESKIIRATNRVREALGMGPLHPDPILAAAAAEHTRAMITHSFFSHHSPVPGRKEVADRVVAAGGRYEGVGENLAMLGASSASASSFVDGWMGSPGHRENLLHPAWDAIGVGAATDEEGQVFATQLFGATLPLCVERVALDAVPHEWLTGRVGVDIGVGNALSVFVRNRFLASAHADVDGRAVLEFDLPTAPGQHHGGFGRRPADSDVGWIGVYEGVAKVDSNGGTWQPGPLATADVRIREETLHRVSGSQFRATLTGRARQGGVVVVDQQHHCDLEPGSGFQVVVAFRQGTGTHHIEVGLPQSADRYRVCQRFELDTYRGTLEETRL